MKNKLPYAVDDNPGVIEALREGRYPDDIMLLECRKCGRLGYYNQGSGFGCHNCGASYAVSEEDCDNAITLQDHMDSEIFERFP